LFGVRRNCFIPKPCLNLGLPFFDSHSAFCSLLSALPPESYREDNCALDWFFTLLIGGRGKSQLQ
ncbi:unnamed protein product, partial [Prunus brigantina]